MKRHNENVINGANIYNRYDDGSLNGNIIGTDKRMKHFESNLVQFGSFVNATSSNTQSSNSGKFGSIPVMNFANNVALPILPAITQSNFSQSRLQNPQKIYPPAVGVVSSNLGVSSSSTAPNGNHFIPIPHSPGAMDCGDANTDADIDQSRSGAPPNFPLFNRHPHPQSLSRSVSVSSRSSSHSSIPIFQDPVTTSIRSSMSSCGTSAPSSSVFSSAFSSAFRSAGSVGTGLNRGRAASTALGVVGDTSGSGNHQGYGHRSTAGGDVDSGMDTDEMVSSSATVHGNGIDSGVIILSNQQCHRCIQYKSAFKACYFCTKLTCGDCIGTCYCCGEAYCAGCSVLNYSKATMPVHVCLDCNSSGNTNVSNGSTLGGNGYGNDSSSNSGHWTNHTVNASTTSHRSTAAFQVMR